MLSLFAVVHADDHDGVGDQPTIVALFIEYLQSTVDDVDVPAAVGQRFQHGLAIHRLGLGTPMVTSTRISSAVLPTSRGNPKLL